MMRSRGAEITLYECAEYPQGVESAVFAWMIWGVSWRRRRAMGRAVEFAATLSLNSGV
jgi:hypothetical protein